MNDDVSYIMVTKLGDDLEAAKQHLKLHPSYPNAVKVQTLNREYKKLLKVMRSRIRLVWNTPILLIKI